LRGSTDTEPAHRPGARVVLIAATAPSHAIAAVGVGHAFDSPPLWTTVGATDWDWPTRVDAGRVLGDAAARKVECTSVVAAGNKLPVGSCSIPTAVRNIRPGASDSAATVTATLAWLSAARGASASAGFRAGAAIPHRRILCGAACGAGVAEGAEAERAEARMLRRSDALCGASAVSTGCCFGDSARRGASTAGGMRPGPRCGRAAGAIRGALGAGPAEVSLAAAVEGRSPFLMPLAA
jgi:hypothetical protein